MWARIIEFMLACWLAISQFIFRYGPDMTFERANDLICATLIAALALGSYARPLRHLHLAHLLVAAWLIGVGVAASDSNPPAPAYQNYVVFGVVLAMVTIVPSRADDPPIAWQRYYNEPTAEPSSRTEP